MQEKAAGKKRLMLTFYIYKLFGRNAVYLIAFFVSFFTFLSSPDLRFYSKKYLKIISDYTKIKPSLLNQFRHVLSYGITLADKLIMYSGGFNPDNIIFDSEADKNILFNDIAKKQGVCFLFSHTGCIEVLQSFFQNQKVFPGLNVNIFLSRNQTKIFDSFIQSVKKPMPVKYIITEDFDISELIKLKQNLEEGGIVFIAGGRLPDIKSSKAIEKQMFNHAVKLPKGSFKLAKLLETPVYFISALRQKDGKYKIYLKKDETADTAESFIKYMEGIILNYPFQFYHFYDFFYS